MPGAWLDSLTARETEVLVAVARGLTNAEIGVALYVRGDRQDPALRGVAHSLLSG